MFKFNFSSAPDSDSESDLPDAPTILQPPTSTVLPPRAHSLRTLSSTIPRNVSYTTLHLSSTLSLPRRELYDVKMQLMSEDSSLPASETPGATPAILTTSESSDLEKNIYEGGLKSWECSLDLTRFLAAETASGAGAIPNSILELGCGSALPSLYMFQQMLKTPVDSQGGRRRRLVLADYNMDVLRLVTLPNLFLVWVREQEAWLPEEGDVDAAPSLVERFVEDVERRGIEVGFLEGGWGMEMLGLLGEGYELVMASETIYEPATMGVFVETFLGSLGGVGLVAAKKHYFGVGGGVEEFLGCLEERGGWEAGVCDETGEAGVKRCIVKVNRKA